MSRIGVQDLEMMRLLIRRRVARGDVEYVELDSRLRNEIYRVLNGPELDFWMSARAAERKTAWGVVNDRLAESRAGRLRVTMPCEPDIMRQILALCAEGSVNVILETRT